MERVCDDCGAGYDDALCVTYCPHDQFIAAVDAARKDYAAALIDRRVRFKHEAATGPDRTIQSIDHAGYVTLAGVDGLFNPLHFTVVE